MKEKKLRKQLSKAIAKELPRLIEDKKLGFSIQEYFDTVEAGITECLSLQKGACKCHRRGR